MSNYDALVWTCHKLGDLHPDLCLRQIADNKQYRTAVPLGDGFTNLIYHDEFTASYNATEMYAVIDSFDSIRDAVDRAIAKGGFTMQSLHHVIFGTAVEYIADHWPALCHCETCSKQVFMFDSATSSCMSWRDEKQAFMEMTFSTMLQSYPANNGIMADQSRVRDMSRSRRDYMRQLYIMIQSLDDADIQRDMRLALTNLVGSTRVMMEYMVEHTTLTLVFDDELCSETLAHPPVKFDDSLSVDM